MRGEALARHYAAADLFVFPSTPIHLASYCSKPAPPGLRIAAMSAPGPLDIFGGDGDVATLDCDLASAIARALDCRKIARGRARLRKNSTGRRAPKGFMRICAPRRRNERGR